MANPKAMPALALMFPQVSLLSFVLIFLLQNVHFCRHMQEYIS